MKILCKNSITTFSKKPVSREFSNFLKTFYLQRKTWNNYKMEEGK